MISTETDKVREALFFDPFVSNEDYGCLVEEAAQADDYASYRMEADDMNADEIFTTETDACLDTLAALDMYEGGFGSDETKIDAVEEAPNNCVLVTVSNGDQFLIRVRAL